MTTTSANQDLEYVARSICSVIDEAISFSEDNGHNELYRMGDFILNTGFDPSTMKDEDVIALVTPLLQNLVLGYLEDARDAEEEQ